MNTPPSPGTVAFAYFIQLVAAVLAVLLARRRAEHRPVAVFLVSMAVIDLGRALLRGAFDLGSPGPYAGARRMAFHLDELGFLAWPAGLAALALVLFAVHRPWPAFAAWGAMGVALMGLYPSALVRGAGLQRIYLAAHVSALFVVATTLATWSLKREQPGSERAVMLVLCAIELARLAGFYGPIFDHWASLMQPANTILYGLLATVQGGFLWTSSRSS